MWFDSYSVLGPVEKIIPVSYYIPGCPPRPEAMISGILKLIEKVKAQAAAKSSKE